MLSDAEQVRLLGMLVVGFLLFAAMGCWKNLRFLRRARRTVGKVVSIRHGNPLSVHRGGISITVEFERLDGKTVCFQGQGHPRYRHLVPLQAVPVRFDPANPSAARIDFLLSLWGMEIMMGLFGAVTLTLFFYHDGLQAFVTG